MPTASPEELLAYLEALGIATETHAHRPVFTVAESADIKAALPGGHSKNLFLKDRKGRMFLVVALHETTIDLKRLHEPLGASGRLSFGSADLLRDTLGVEPGSVTPFALFNDRDRKVEIVLDARLMRHPLVNFHPLVNSRTTAIAAEGLLLFLQATGHAPRILDLPVPPAQTG